MTILTANEFISQELNIPANYSKRLGRYVYPENAIEEALIKFASSHVQATLRKIVDGSLDDITKWSGNPYSGEGDIYLDEKAILKMYPLTNIK